MPDWLQTLYEEMMKPPYFLQHTTKAKSEAKPQTPQTAQAETQGDRPSAKGEEKQRSDVRHRPETEHAEPIINASTRGDSRARTSTNERTSTTSRTLLHDVPSEVLARYPFEISDREQFPDVVRVTTKSGKRYAVKRTTLTMQHVRFIHRFLTYARSQGYVLHSQLVLTKKKSPGVFYEGNAYYATEWIDGQNANFTHAEQVAQTAYSLAQLNEATRGFQTDKYAPPDAFDLFNMTQERMRDLRHMLIRADANQTPDAFDQLFASMKDQLLEDASQSLQRLQHVECVDFLAREQKRPGISHLDVIPENCLYAPDHKVHLIDFELSTFAPRALDIAHLLRRSLQLTNWNGDLAYACFLHFNSVRTISKPEYRLVQALLQFPYLAWRLAHTRYHYFKSSAQLDELERYAEQDRKRQQFLSSLDDQIGSLTLESSN